jgi:hypothetical protein
MTSRWSDFGLVFGVAIAIAGCGTSTPSSSGSAGSTGSAAGAAGATAGGAGGSTSSGTAGSTASGTAGSTSGAAGSTTGVGGNSNPGSGQGGSGGGVMCTPGVQAALITDCGYPTMGGGTLAAVAFSENEVLRAIQPEDGMSTGIVRMFYNDEHAMTLGVRSVVVKSAGGSMTMAYPVSPLSADPSSVMNPQTGTNELLGDQSGLDQSLRPMWPVLYITDITANPQDRSGDWQQGGRPAGPDAVFGSWKAAVRTVDQTKTPSAVTITPDMDPMKNNWTLGGGDPVPTGLMNQGYGAEVRWSVPLTAGHSYRVQVIVHDGDQNKAGGDCGEACVLFCSGGTSSTGAGGEGGGPPPTCPTGTMACGGGIDPVSCPSGTVCANGCCLPVIP